MFRIAPVVEMLTAWLGEMPENAQSTNVSSSVVPTLRYRPVLALDVTRVNTDSTTRSSSTPVATVMPGAVATSVTRAPPTVESFSP